MSTPAEQRATIISSVFSRRNASGNLEESYVSHLKVWEDAGSEGRKPRYILLSKASNTSGFLHKSKLNTNGTYSVGKTWKLSELRGVHVLSSSAFNITLSRSYKWETESLQDQTTFLDTLIDTFNSITGGSVPLRIEGMSKAPQPLRNPIMSNQTPPTSGPSPILSSSPLNGRSARNVSQGSIPTSDRESDRASGRSQSRNGYSRPVSPASSHRIYSSSRDHSIPPRPPSSTSQISSRPSRTGHALTNTASSISSLLPSTSGSSLSTRPSSRSSIEQPQAPVMLKSSRSRSRPPSPISSTTSRSTIPVKDPSRNRPPRPSPPPDTRTRRDPNARISYFDHANQAALDILLLQGSTEGEGEEESSQFTLASVEEMIEGYEWASDDVIGRKTGKGAAELIEARLLDELMALDKANIHSFLETDDRVALVMKFMDDAMSELDNMDSLVSSYKIHLNAVGDDISFIQSQNRGLQVQTQNQRALLSELQNLLNTVQVNQKTLVSLTQESLEKTSGIQRLEEAASELYKALQAGRDTEMAASMERLQEYRTHNTQFCKRILDFLSIMFTAQATMLLGDTEGVLKDNHNHPTVLPHTEMESYLGRYAGLMLFLKEMDEPVYGKTCANYFSASSELANIQMKSLFSGSLALVRRFNQEEGDQKGSKPAAGMRRAGTLMRSPLDGTRKDKDKESGDMAATDVFRILLEQLSSMISREDEFIADFLQINDAALTFADYMNLDSYFRRQATRSVGLSATTMKLVRGAMDLIFGSLPVELKSWMDGALQRDELQIFGIIACLERFLSDADEKGNQFLLGALGKQHVRLKAQLDRHINDQVRLVEQTKLTNKKRRGVVHFIKHFPVYLGRVEPQLVGADALEIRRLVDSTYERLIQTMFDCLKQMAKMESADGEDKGQLNYHIILIENMHYFVSEISQLELGSVGTYVRRAEAVYNENVAAYVKATLRRPFGKIIDYFEGIEGLLKNTAPTEIATNSNYNKSSMKKIAKDYNSRDVRKHVDSIVRRIEKHFTDGSDNASQGIAPGTVMASVCKAFEDELLRITELFSKRIAQCYGDSGIGLEYTQKDIEAAFRKQRVGV